MAESFAKLRGSTYEGLAVALGPPAAKFYRMLNQKLLRPLKILQEDLSWPILEGAQALDDFIREKTAKGPDKASASLRVEYHRLFVGPYKLAAPPYASLYLEGEPAVMGRSTLEVLKMYEQAGFLLSPSFKDLPDHVAAELEFMALLCEGQGAAWQRSDFFQAGKQLEWQENFLREHLVRWIPKFSSKILSSTESPYYRALASLLRNYVSLDLDYARASRRLLDAEVSAMAPKGRTRDGN
jgi:TorA maturation chaperone TorD